VSISLRSKVQSLPSSASIWVKFGILAVLVGLLYFPVIPPMVVQWWKDPNYSHGFLIPLVSLFLVWRRRDVLKHLPKVPSDWGLPVMVGGISVLTVGLLGAELFLTRSSLIAVLSGIVVYLGGWGLLRALLFPIAYLIFMVPLPFLVFNAVAFPLQLLAARVAQASLEILGIPVLREGNIIHLPGASLEVVDACSGIRSLMSLAALGTLFAYFTQRSLWKRAVLVLSTIPIAVATNALRVSGTGFLAYHFGQEAAEGFFHEFSGLVVFGSALVLLFLEGALLRMIGKGRGSGPLPLEALDN